MGMQMAAVRDELDALNQYHQTVATRDVEGQASLLRNGFLPESPEALVEAGIRCLPLLESGVTDLTAAAGDRLAAIQVKLELLPQTAPVTRALEQFKARVEGQKREDDKAAWYGCAAILALAAIIGGVIVLVVYFFTR